MEGAGEVDAGGDEDLAAAGLGALIDGGLDGGGVEGLAVAEGAALADVEGDLRLLSPGGL